MKRIVKGILKKANNKVAEISVENGVVMQVVDLGKFKPFAGEFFDACAEVLTKDFVTEHQDLATFAGEDGDKVWAGTCDGGEVILRLTDETVAPCEDAGEPCEADDQLVSPEDGENDGDPVMSGNFEVEEPCECTIAENDMAVISFNPKYKKDGTFISLENVVVAFNLNYTLPEKLKVKPIVETLGE